MSSSSSSPASSALDSHKTTAWQAFVSLTKGYVGVGSIVSAVGSESARDSLWCLWMFPHGLLEFLQLLDGSETETLY